MFLLSFVIFQVADVSSIPFLRHIAKLALHCASYTQSHTPNGFICSPKTNGVIRKRNFMFISS